MERKIRGISYGKILSEFNIETNNYPEIYDNIKELESVNKIRPNKSSGYNSMNPPLYKRYFVVTDDRDASKYIHEINYKLNMKIIPTFYRNNINIYLKERDYVLLLNDFLNTKTELLKEKTSDNARSFQIWRDEKFIEKGQGKTVVKHCANSNDENEYIRYLNIYKTVEPISVYSLNTETPQTILILENLEPYYTIKKIFTEEGVLKILGRNISSIIYGSGNKIQSSFSEFKYLSEYLNNSDNNILYFGDIDLMGISIYESLANRYPEYKITPFTEAYKRMILKAVNNYGIENLPFTKEGQMNYKIGEIFLSYFDEENSSIIKSILNKGRYIPQEILTIRDYKGGCHE